MSLALIIYLIVMIAASSIPIILYGTNGFESLTTRNAKRIPRKEKKELKAKQERERIAEEADKALEKYRQEEEERKACQEKDWDREFDALLPVEERKYIETKKSPVNKAITRNNKYTSLSPTDKEQDLTYSQRLVGPKNVNIREYPTHDSKIVGTLNPFTVVSIDAWTKGQRLVGDPTWYKTLNGYIWAGACTRSSVSGIAEETLVPEELEDLGETASMDKLYVGGMITADRLYFSEGELATNFSQYPSVSSYELNAEKPIQEKNKV